MSTNTPAASAANASFLERNHLLFRRLHSLTGIVPIGVFLIAHLVTNSSIMWGNFALRDKPRMHGDGLLPGGAAYFDHEVIWINNQVPHLLLIEITLWVSIAFHSILGVYYARTGTANTGSYPYGSNWRYVLQRLSGYVGILFIFYHVATLRWGWTWLTPGGIKWSHTDAARTLAQVFDGGTQGQTFLGIIVALAYFVCVSLLVFHFANGLWTAAITWGLTISQGAQRRWGYVCFVIGAGLMLAAWGSILGFVIFSPGATVTPTPLVVPGH